ncbi:GDP-L-fucose synthase family protein [Elstera cyanobacteriorum]|uniref:GDP-L-fucose synthase family protein n=1 Tax=Elstera cyanobacteriorum TaxID=2022747 RepID=UPI00402BE687
MMDRSAKILVAGARGLVGGAIVRQLRAQGFENLLTPFRAELDLTDRAALDAYLAQHKPQFVFDAAAKVGGIQANNQFPGDFIRDNLLIQTNLIDASYRAGVEKFVFLGSSCIYPKFAPQPMKEEHLLTGILEPTNSAYAVAKIAGIEMVKSYRRQFGFKGISLMPTNLYGPGDNYDLNNSHVLPALIRKFHEAKQSHAKEVVIWGTGTPRREFLHCDDLADAAIFLMQTYDSDDIINVGVGDDIAIGEVARMIKEIVGFDGALVQDTSKPDGTPRKLLDVSRLTALGWRPKLSLREGITQTYAAYQATLAAA